MSGQRGDSQRWVHFAIGGLLLAAAVVAVPLGRRAVDNARAAVSTTTQGPSSNTDDGDPSQVDEPSTNGDVGTTPGSVLPLHGPGTPMEVTPAEGSITDGTFTDGFDESPTSPAQWNPSNWDVTVHSRNVETFQQLQTMQAAHGADCAGPPAEHPISSYDQAVFSCKDHMMTAIYAEGYGMIYLTPPAMVDFSQGATISFDISTARTSVRDWWDVWITPYEDSLQLPLDLGTDVDATGPPKRAVRVGLGTENELEAQVFRDFQAEIFDSFPEDNVPGDTSGYENFLEPDAARRDTVTIELSTNHIKVGMPEYDFWWVDADIPKLDWSRGIVQLGHHSYNPAKDCNETNTPKPPVTECTPNTWHWDNLSISPSVPFTIDRAEERALFAGGDTATWAAPAPAGGDLRFTGIGKNMEVSFDGGDTWVKAEASATAMETQEDHFASYWMPIPEGTTSVMFRAEDWYGGPWWVRDPSIWSGGS